MITPIGEARPLCKWPDHDWNLTEYWVADTGVDDADGKRINVVTQSLKCNTCGRIRFIRVDPSETRIVTW